jgi:hypothetical protein
MTRKLQAVADHPARRRGRPPTRLISAVDKSEREVLVILRRKLAARLDEGVPTHALAALVRQLRDVDKDIRALDARAAQADDDEDDDDDGEQAGWDETAL